MHRLDLRHANMGWNVRAISGLQRETKGKLPLMLPLENPSAPVSCSNASLPSTAVGEVATVCGRTLES